MKTMPSLALAVVSLALHGAARAFAVTGLLPPSTPPRITGSTVAVPETRSGVITAVRADPARGTWIEIGGRALLVRAGRTVVLRNGLPVDVGTLRAGQTVKYSMATTTPGETALGVVDAP